MSYPVRSPKAPMRALVLSLALILSLSCGFFDQAASPAAPTHTQTPAETPTARPATDTPAPSPSPTPIVEKSDIAPPTSTFTPIVDTPTPVSAGTATLTPTLDGSPSATFPPTPTFPSGDTPTPTLTSDGPPELTATPSPTLTPTSAYVFEPTSTFPPLQYPLNMNGFWSGRRSLNIKTRNCETTVLHSLRWRIVQEDDKIGINDDLFGKIDGNVIVVSGVESFSGGTLELTYILTVGPTRHEMRGYLYGSAHLKGICGNSGLKEYNIQGGHVDVTR